MVAFIMHNITNTIIFELLPEHGGLYDAQLDDHNLSEHGGLYNVQFEFFPEHGGLPPLLPLQPLLATV